MSETRRAVLVIPACEPGRGGGHLVRCMALARGLRDLGREACLCFPIADDTAPVNSLLDAAGFDRSWLIDEDALLKKDWECIILDRFQTPPEELARRMKLAPVIGIDEGGKGRTSFDFLIDILPNCESVKPNVIDPSLLPLPEKPPPKDKEPGTPLKVLISFGQEDAAGLGLAVARALAAKNNGDVLDITLLRGKLEAAKPRITTPHSIKIIEAIPNLSEHLNEYDLIITHYGLTAFEALYADIAVALVSPGAYHEKLAKTAGFYSLGVGKGRAKRLPGLLLKKGALHYQFLNKLTDRCSALAVRHKLNAATDGSVPRQSLAELINGFEPGISRNCPVCGSALDNAGLYGSVIARFSERTYYRCKRCGIIGMNRLTPPPIEYEREYFFDFYQKQYGKTYIEDFPNLIAMAKRRLAVIKSLLPKTGEPLLLDIGCAYGPFLAAAREDGFSPHGIDPAEDAVRYVTQTLGIPAVQGFFPAPHSPLPIPHSYDVITLWYVIEHFRDCVPALAEIRKLLKPGGVLAFATPSFSGVSGRSSLGSFLERSPADHWTVWSPAACRRALREAGFTVKKTAVSGHHPERFPLLGAFARSRKSPLYWALLGVSIIFSLGDTFEAYATTAPLLRSSRSPFRRVAAR